MLTTQKQTLEVNHVGRFVAAAIVFDQESDGWVRELQVFRRPDVDGAKPVLVLTVRLRAARESDLHLSQG